MKRKIVATLLACVCAFSAFSLVACDDKKQVVGDNLAGDSVSGAVNTPIAQSVAPAKKGAELDYYSGLGDKSQYDVSKFYRNDLRTDGADPGAIFCSEEDITDTYNKVKATARAQAAAAWDEYAWEEANGTLDDWLIQYAGNFYVAVTGDTSAPSASVRQKYDSIQGAFALFKSTDLVDWEEAGLIDGYALNVRNSSWTTACYWAPEIIRDPLSGRYFMFASAQAKSGNSSTEYIPHEGIYYNMLYGVLAMSDNPVGPYELVTSENYYKTICAYNADGTVKVNGSNELLDPQGNVLTTVDSQGNILDKNGHLTTEQTPVFNFGLFNESIRDSAKYQLSSHSHRSAMFPTIDYSPMLDDGELYVYFSEHISSNEDESSICGIKMKDFITPDFDTFTTLAAPNYESVTKIDPTVNGDINNFSRGRALSAISPGWNEGTINEGAQVIPHVDSVSGQTKYFLTFSPFGYMSRSYSVCQAVSDSPLGPFTKLNMSYNPIMGINNTNDYMSGTGHHSFIKAGDELFMLYHAYLNPNNNMVNGSFLGRALGADRVQFMYNATLGYDILYGNGPTYSLQPLPEVTSGMTNVAKYATITVDGVENTKNYLNDGLFTVHAFSADKEYKSISEKRGTTVTLTWEEPVTVSALVVYNAQNYLYAFDKLDVVSFKLAEKPSWYPEGAAYNGYCFIDDVLCDPENVNVTQQYMRQGGGALAAFNPITISELSFHVSSKYTTRSADGQTQDNYQINISEIYLMGNVA